MFALEVLRLNWLLIRTEPRLYLEEVAVAIPTYWFPVTTAVSDFDSRVARLLWTAVQLGVTVLFFCSAAILLGYGSVLATVPTAPRGRLTSLITSKGSLFLVSFLVPVAIVIYTMLISIAVNVGNPRHRASTDLLILFTIALGMHFLLHLRERLSAWDGRLH